jgi:hypothetical protein
LRTTYNFCKHKDSEARSYIKYFGICPRTLIAEWKILVKSWQKHRMQHSEKLIYMSATTRVSSSLEFQTSSSNIGFNSYNIEIKSLGLLSFLLPIIFRWNSCRCRHIDEFFTVLHPVFLSRFDKNLSFCNKCTRANTEIFDKMRIFFSLLNSRVLFSNIIA